MRLSPSGRSFVSSALRGIFYAAALCAVVTAILLIATYVQLRLHDPLAGPVVPHLIERLEKDPANTTIAEEIRAVDLLGRKAYFTAQWQLRFGTVLLLVAVAIMLISGKALAALSINVPLPPRTVQSDTWWKERTISRKAIFITGSILIIIALVAGWWTDHSLSAPFRGGNNASSGRPPERDTWPSFRGPGGIGIASVTDVPVGWDGATMRGVRWKATPPLPGNSSPIVGGGCIFLTGGDKKTRELYCYNLNNGRLIWKRRVRTAPDSVAQHLKIDKETGYAAPTAVYDNKRVFAIFPTGELICCTINGKVVWERCFRAPVNHYGHASSLIADGGLLFVQLDQYDDGNLYALQTATGKTVWSVKRKQLSWSSPILVSSGRQRELILADNLDVVSYDPNTGSVHWRHDCLSGEVGPSAAYAAGRVFVANENANAVGIALPGTDRKDSSEIIWTWNDNLPSTASPVATDRFLFLATAEGIVSCVDTRKGTTMWDKEFETGFYASPVIVGEKVYLLDRKGVMRIFAAADSYRSIDNPELGEAAVTTPAMLDGQIIIRGKKHLFCIGGAGE